MRRLVCAASKIVWTMSGLFYAFSSSVQSIGDESIDGSSVCMCICTVFYNVLFLSFFFSFLTVCWFRPQICHFLYGSLLYWNETQKGGIKNTSNNNIQLCPKVVNRTKWNYFPIDKTQTCEITLRQNIRAIIKLYANAANLFRYYRR